MMRIPGSCFGTPFTGVIDLISICLVMLGLAMTIKAVIWICNRRSSKCKFIEIEGSEKFTYDNKVETEELALTQTFKKKS